MSDFYSCEAPQAFSETIRKARKSHKCCECFRQINIGEKYQYVSGIWDGDPDSFKTCLSCYEIRNDFISLPENDTASIGCLRDEISGFFYTNFGLNEYSESSGICIEKLNKLFGIPQHEPL